MFNLRNCRPTVNQPSHVKNVISWVLRRCRTTWGNLRQSSSWPASSITSCESKGAWRSRIPPLAAGHWWSPPAWREIPPSEPGILGRYRSRILAGHSPAATHRHSGYDIGSHLRSHSLTLMRTPERCSGNWCHSLITLYEENREVCSCHTSSSIFMLNKFSQELQLSNMKWISKTHGTEMKWTTPGSCNGPSTILICKLANWLSLECVQAPGPHMQKPQGFRHRRGSLAGGVMTLWLASGSEAATTFTGLSPELKKVWGSSATLQFWLILRNKSLELQVVCLVCCSYLGTLLSTNHSQLDVKKTHNCITAFVC